MEIALVFTWGHRGSYRLGNGGGGPAGGRLKKKTEKNVFTCVAFLRNCAQSAVKFVKLFGNLIIEHPRYFTLNIMMADFLFLLKHKNKMLKALPNCYSLVPKERHDRK